MKNSFNQNKSFLLPKFLPVNVLELRGLKSRKYLLPALMPKNCEFIKYKELLNLCVREMLEADVSLACNKCVFARLTRNFWTVLFREFPFSACYLLTSASTKSYGYLHNLSFKECFCKVCKRICLYIGKFRLQVS